ncbi:MAG: AmmeMemoRadiSam system radical SAM enzyme [Candidatus Diapherotrites archaeon CG08_land_8_20_14_0_20_30_16]|nr:MAG: AmmeMemoRadiSam system radical SAM enzyme [Candidatus Diapherotrites archaeon CG08_land_8_20_14_0_20_30_16]
MKKCVLFKKLTSNKVKCLACNHYCTIAETKTGICGVRKNIKGKLYLLVYDKVVAQNIDPIEKKPLYHFLPGTKAYSIGTVGCNFFCKGCQNWDISQERKIIGKELTPKEIVNDAIKNKCKSIAYTYNEPSIFIEFVKATAILAHKKGLKNILVTNGYLSKESLAYIGKTVDAMNIDLKSFSEKYYKKFCGAKLKPVLDTIKLAHKKKIWIEITTLLVPNENDSVKELINIGQFIASVNKNIPWHISRFFPMYKMTNKKETDIKKLEEAYKIGKKYLNFVYVGNLHKENNTLCPKCGSIVIDRFGYNVKNNLNNNKCKKCNSKVSGVYESNKISKKSN